MDKMFPIDPYRMKGEPWFPREIPWAAAETFRTQAEKNHGQTLERLADRGGLSPEEIYFAVKGLGTAGRLTRLGHIEALRIVVGLAEGQHG